MKPLRELLASATPGPWFSVGPPWNVSGLPWINAGSEDPHGGTPVCEMLVPDDNHEHAEWDRVAADAALVVSLRNQADAWADLFDVLPTPDEAYAGWWANGFTAEEARKRADRYAAALSRLAATEPQQEQGGNRVA